MRIGGFLPLSLCDYPGIPAAVVFTQGCNFRCPFCHNGRLVSRVSVEGQLIPEAEILERLRIRRPALDGVVLSGGEPTLQPDLPRFIALVKSMGYLVKLDTNGSHPEVLEMLIRDRLVDCVAMDIKAAPDYYAALSGLPAPPRAVGESSGCRTSPASEPLTPTPTPVLAGSACTPAPRATS